MPRSRSLGHKACSKSHKGNYNIVTAAEKCTLPPKLMAKSLECKMWVKVIAITAAEKHT